MILDNYEFTFRKRSPILFYICVISIVITLVLFRAPYFALFITIFWLFIEYFYRLPKRSYSTSSSDLRKLDNKLGLYRDYSLDETFVLSPSYGTIKKIEYEKEFIRITSILEVIDVHYQYAPISGNLIDIRYKEGEFYIAHFLEKSRYNERNHCIFRNENGLKVEVIQIAGVLARRIEILKKDNKYYEIGEPYGLIHFGSRVDTIIPNTFKEKSITLLVKEGDKLNGPDTKLCIYS